MDDRSRITDSQVPVNRPLVGCLALGCLGLGMLVGVSGIEGTTNLWQGALTRVGVILGALWLCLPTRHREAAWARVPIGTVVVFLVGLLIIVRARVPIVWLAIASVGLAVSVLVLTPWNRQRPRD
jgi:hypothetical protein